MHIDNQSIEINKWKRREVPSYRRMLRYFLLEYHSGETVFFFFSVLLWKGQWGWQSAFCNHHNKVWFRKASKSGRHFLIRSQIICIDSKYVPQIVYWFQGKRV